jgi:hypothetical protein
VTHHTAFTLEVEQTLQAINPTIAMPYWGRLSLPPIACIIAYTTYYCILRLTGLSGSGSSSSIGTSVAMCNGDTVAEYGMDSILYGENYQDSPIFNDDWFGQANPINSKHELDSGRWSKIKMPSGRHIIILQTVHTYMHTNNRKHYATYTMNFLCDISGSKYTKWDIQQTGKLNPFVNPYGTTMPHIHTYIHAYK